MLAIAAGGYIATSVIVFSYKLDRKHLLTHWVLVEAISFPCLIFYYSLQIFYLRK